MAARWLTRSDWRTGEGVGKSLVEPDHKQTALDAEAKAKKLKVDFELPVDVVVATPVETGKLNKKGKPVFDFTNIRTVSGRHSRRRGRFWHR